MKCGLGGRIGVPAGLIEYCLSIRLSAQSLDAHSCLAVMDFNEIVRLSKKFYQAVEGHIREDRERAVRVFRESGIL